MDWKKIIVPTVGGIAFVIGGLIARTKAIEGVETLDSMFHKKSPESEPHVITRVPPTTQH